MKKIILSALVSLSSLAAPPHIFCDIDGYQSYTGYQIGPLHTNNNYLPFYFEKVGILTPFNAQCWMTQNEVVCKSAYFDVHVDRQSLLGTLTDYPNNYRKIYSNCRWE